MHLCICNHRTTHLADGLNIYLALFSAALFGVDWRGGSYSHKFYPPSGASDICPLVGLFCFTRCIVQHLGILEKNTESSAPFLGVTFCLCPEFLEKAQRLSASLMSISAGAGLSVSSSLFLYFCPATMIG